MDNFDPYRNDDPITYAVKTGDISRGASPSDVSVASDDQQDYSVDAVAPASKAQAILGLVLAIIFLIAAILSF